MAAYARKVQRLADWLAAGNTLPDFAAGHVQDFLAGRGVAAQGVSIQSDGTVVIAETDATTQKLVANLDAITPDVLDPEKAEETQVTAVMAQLDAFADTIEAGGLPALLPSLIETQRTLARSIRVMQFLVARRKR